MKGSINSATRPAFSATFEPSARPVRLSRARRVQSDNFDERQSLILLPATLCLPALCGCACIGEQRSETTDDHAAVDPRTLFADPTRENYRLLAAEVDANLKQQVLANWYPRALDVERGGFIQNLNEDWTPAPGGAKGIVYESRLTWTAAKAAQRFPEKSALYSDAAREGLKFLADKMWDSQHGGFYWSVDPTGNPDPRPRRLGRLFETSLWQRLRHLRRCRRV